MKYLSHYIEQQQTQLFNDLGAFFAFSDKQYEEAKKPDVVYVSCGGGLIAPKGTVAKLAEGLATIRAEGIKEDIAENGKAAIIQRELGNYAAQITGDIDDTVSALDGYDISRDDVRSAYPEYLALCVKYDHF